MKHALMLAAGIVIGATGLFVSQVFLAGHNDSRPYAGQDKRVISSLSATDIDQLEKGEGWGLAKPAEFNGYPGPAHVLEFADSLDLTAEQRQTIELAFRKMKSKARELGVALVEAEAALDRAFKNQTVNEQLLQKKLKVAESIRASLRAVHLSAHLEITPLLTNEQKKHYASLRGYGNGHSEHAGH